MKYLLLTLALLASCGCRYWSQPVKLPADSVPVAVAAAEPPTAIDQYKEALTRWAVRGATVAAILLMAGTVAVIGFKLPGGKDVILVGGILLLGSGTIALYIDYAGWILFACGLAFACYFIWVLYRRGMDKQVQAELVQSAEYLKQVTDWNEPVKNHLRLMQSPETKAVVDRVQGKAT